MRDDTLDAYARLYNRVDELLHYIWDPIGVAGVPEARDEYDSYVPPVVDMLRKEQSVESIAGHLHRIEVEGMGLTAFGAVSDRTRRVAELLVQNHRFINRAE